MRTSMSDYAYTNGDGAVGNGDSTVAAPKTPYQIPEFSAATQMILQRLRASGGPLAPNSQLSMGIPLAPGAALPPGYEDVKRSVMEGYKTTMGGQDAMVNPAKKSRPSVVRTTESQTSTPGPKSETPVPTSRSKSIPKSKKRTSGKRKRVQEVTESEEESESFKARGESDSEEEVTILPAQTLSGRKVVKPTTFVPPPPTAAPPRKRTTAAYNKKTGRNVEQALCKRCSRGNSPSTNQIVFCDSCNNGWHQNCHDPRITDDLVKDQSAQWFCKTCTEKKAAKAAKRDKGKHSAPVKPQIPAAPPKAAVAPKAQAPQPSPAPPPPIAALPPPPPASTPIQPLPTAIPTFPGAAAGAGWGNMTNGEKRQYLMQVPYEHLVSAFIHATNLYPSLPVMPQSIQPVRPYVSQPPVFQHHQPHQQYQPMNNLGRGRPYNQQPFPPSAVSAAHLFPRSTANPNATMNFIRKIPDAQNHVGSYMTAMGYPNNPYQSPHHLGHTNSAPPSIAEHPVFENAMDVDMNLGREEQHPPPDPFGVEHGRPVQHGPTDPHPQPQPHEEFLNDVVHVDEEDVEEEASDQSRDSTPASPPYPKAGTGAMSKLKTDDEELEWLVGGEEDEVAFRHTILEAT